MTRLITAACAVAVLTATSACSLTESNDTTSSKGAGTITVDSTADACKLTATKAPSGNVAFKVKNSGDQVTEFYLYGEDGMRIVGEIENVGPGLTRDLVVRAEPGKYVTACKPGMKGNGIREDFTVTDSGKDTTIKGVDQADIDAATTQYAAYVKDQSQQLLDQTTEFVDAYKAGDDDEGPGAVPRGPSALGADRDRRRVLRRPRPEDRPARGRPRAGPGVDRLAPHREGPVAAGQRLPRPDPRRAGEVRRRPAGQHRGLRQGVQNLDVHRRPDRATAPRACSTRSPAARSPARRTSGRTPTCGTSRPTSTAPASATRD